jgi:hypothetical protein
MQLLIVFADMIVKLLPLCTEMIPAFPSLQKRHSKEQQHCKLNGINTSFD